MAPCTHTAVQGSCTPSYLKGTGFMYPFIPSYPHTTLPTESLPKKAESRGLRVLRSTLPTSYCFKPCPATARAALSPSRRSLLGLSFHLACPHPHPTHIHTCPTRSCTYSCYLSNSSTLPQSPQSALESPWIAGVPNKPRPLPYPSGLPLPRGRRKKWQGSPGRHQGHLPQPL